MYRWLLWFLFIYNSLISLRYRFLDPWFDWLILILNIEFNLNSVFRISLLGFRRLQILFSKKHTRFAVTLTAFLCYILIRKNYNNSQCEDIKTYNWYRRGREKMRNKSNALFSPINILQKDNKYSNKLTVKIFYIKMHNYL